MGWLNPVRAIARLFGYLVIFSVRGVWTGEIRASKSFGVVGAPARIVGLMFALTIPLAFLAYWLVNSAMEARGQKPDFRIEPLIAFFATLLGCPLIALVIGYSFSKPSYPPKPRDSRDGFSCLECGEPYPATAAAPGESIRCVSCGRIFIVSSANN